MQVPSALIGALNGLIVLLVVGSEIFRRQQIKHAKASSQASAINVEEEL
jgi:ABC-type uncharacterized transport system permease subunit